jgi:hypothetical protein
MPFLWQDYFRVTTETINPQLPMSAMLEHFPSTQLALFRQYHIGGRSSCGFSLDSSNRLV